MGFGCTYPYRLVCVAGVAPLASETVAFHRVTTLKLLPAAMLARAPSTVCSRSTCAVRPLAVSAGAPLVLG